LEGEEELNRDFFMNVESNKVENNIKKSGMIKKPFFKIGFIILIISIIFLGIINYIPWMYISYESSSQSDLIEDAYYKDFENNGIKNDEINDFFNSKNSSLLIGLDADDFSSIPGTNNYICFLLIVLSICFILITLIDKKINFTAEKLFTLNTVLTSIVIVLNIYLIYTLTIFLGANISSFTNIEILNDTFPKLTIIFPAPLVTISASAILTKICFTVIKSNYKEMQKLSDVKKFKY